MFVKAEHSSFIKPVLMHDEGTALTATPCNHSSFIESILKKLLHLYMMHLAVLSFLNKALSLNQLQDIMKVLSRSEQQHNHNCS